MLLRAMLLEVGKAASLVGCIVSLYAVLMRGILEPNTTWEERLVQGLARLAIAGCVCFASGLLFALPVRGNADRRVGVWGTLPVQMFFWGAGGLVLLFVVAWYLRCGGPDGLGFRRDCS